MKGVVTALYCTVLYCHVLYSICMSMCAQNLAQNILSKRSKCSLFVSASLTKIEYVFAQTPHVLPSSCCFALFAHFPVTQT